MTFDAKKHEILVIKTRLLASTSDNRELYLVKSSDDLASVLRLIPESYHAAIRNSKECVVQLKWARVPSCEVWATTSVVVRMPRHRKWSEIVPDGTTWATSLRDAQSIIIREDGGRRGACGIGDVMGEL